MVNTFFNNIATVLKFKIEKPLKNGCNNMCHMLIFVKSKKIYFKHFSDVLFEHFKNPPLYPNHLR